MLIQKIQNKQNFEMLQNKQNEKKNNSVRKKRPCEIDSSDSEVRKGLVRTIGP